MNKKHTVCLAAALALMAQIPGAYAMRADSQNDQLVRTRVNELHTLLNDMNALVDQEGRVMTSGEQEKYRTLMDELRACNDHLRSRAEANALIVEGETSSTPRLSSPASTSVGMQNNGGAAGYGAGSGSNRLPAQPRGLNAGMNGFANAAEFFNAVKEGSGRNSKPDQRLLRNLTGGSTTTGGGGSEGGFAIPEVLANELMKKVTSSGYSLVSRCKQLETTVDSLKIKVNEQEPWRTGGVTVSWGSELGQITNSKLNGGRVEVELKKAVGMVALSSELMQFSPNMSGMVMDAFAEGLADAYGRAIMFGDNVNQPKGIMHGDPTVAADEAPRIVVPKATGQAAGTIVFDNILRMMASMNPNCQARGIWLCGLDSQYQLMKMKDEANQPVWLPGGQVADTPFDRLMGRPLLVTEFNRPVGSEGDLMFVDLSQYGWLTHADSNAAGQVMQSMHIYFDYDAVAFRVVARVGGRPLWKRQVQGEAAAHPKSSCFVTLQDRV